jgi:hypothetical protein
MSEMKQCPFLNDRVVKGEAINAECDALNKECCPKVRSTKKAVTRQCWRMEALTEAEAKAKADAKAQRLAQKKPKKVPVAKKQKEPKQEKPAPIQNVAEAEKATGTTAAMYVPSLSPVPTNVVDDTQTF